MDRASRSALRCCSSSACCNSRLFTQPGATGIITSSVRNGVGPRTWRCSTHVQLHPKVHNTRLSEALRPTRNYRTTEPPRSTGPVVTGSHTGSHSLVRTAGTSAPPTQQVPATKDSFLVLTSPSSSLRLPTPKPMHNKGNYIVSLR
jgi:hypothetical protein